MLSPWRINTTHEAAQKDLAEIVEAISRNELSAAQIASKCRITTHRIRLLLASLIESQEVLTRRVKSPNKSGHLVYQKAGKACGSPRCAFLTFVPHRIRMSRSRASQPITPCTQER